MVEHARSQAGITDASHAEYGPSGTPVISLLTCDINGVDIAIYPPAASVLAGLHGGATEVVEHTTCNYGLELSVQELASAHGMQVAAVDDRNEVRAVERPDHPFFVATLYQPQLKSTAEDPHPIFLGLIDAAATRG